MSDIKDYLDKKYLYLLVFVLMIPSSAFSQLSETEQSYSDLLKEAVILKSSKYHGPPPMFPIQDEGLIPDNRMPKFAPWNKKLNMTETVPFLIDVLENGLDWTEERDAAIQRKRNNMQGRVRAPNKRDKDLATHSVNQRYSRYQQIARCYAAVQLGAIGDERAVDPLIGILNKEETLQVPRFSVSGNAAVALGMLKSQKAVAHLKNALQDNRSGVRSSSARALSRIGDASVVPSLINAFDEKSDSRVQENMFHSSLNDSLRRLTKIQFTIKTRHLGDEKRKQGNYNVDEWMVSDVKEFPELGTMTFRTSYKKMWQHWFKNGREYTEREFDQRYNQWKQKRAYMRSRHPDKDEAYAAKAAALTRKKIMGLGIAALPYMIDKVNQGDIHMISSISELTGGQLKKNATKTECLVWWNNNKQKWLITFNNSSSQSASTQPAAND
jgi:hypothetical protein